MRRLALVVVAVVAVGCGGGDPRFPTWHYLGGATTSAPFRAPGDVTVPLAELVPADMTRAIITITLCREPAVAGQPLQIEAHTGEPESRRFILGSEDGICPPATPSKAPSFAMEVLTRRPVLTFSGGAAEGTLHLDVGGYWTP